MPIYRLIDTPIFPDPEDAEADGLLAVGGDLSPERLLLAYSSGIFPWFNEGDPILWWSPDPRFILDPSEIVLSKSLSKTIRGGSFEVTYDRAFRDVIEGCAKRGGNGDGTWITDDMTEAYSHLHELGYAHSVESWHEGKLAGGLYGLSLGRCFFGESMFYRVDDASKVAFATMTRDLANLGFELIDCQMPSKHLINFGAKGLSRETFLKRLARGGVLPGTRQERGVFPESP